MVAWAEAARRIAAVNFIIYDIGRGGEEGGRGVRRAENHNLIFRDVEKNCCWQLFKPDSNI